MKKRHEPFADVALPRKQCGDIRLIADNDEVGFPIAQIVLVGDHVGGSQQDEIAVFAVVAALDFQKGIQEADMAKLGDPLVGQQGRRPFRVEPGITAQHINNSLGQPKILAQGPLVQQGHAPNPHRRVGLSQVKILLGEEVQVIVHLQGPGLRQFPSGG